MGIQFRFLILIAICIGPGLTYSQNRNSRGSSPGQNGGQMDYGRDGNKPGTKKDTIVFRMKAFQLQDGHSRLMETRIDTLFADYQTYNPLLKRSLTVQTLGNLGTSAQSNDYFERSFDSKEFMFLRNHKYYGKWAKDILFFNTTKPFTLLEYGQWFSKENHG
jgi:hypothetical protein